MGVFTPTELAAIAAVSAFVVGLLVYRQFRLRDVPRLLVESVQAIAAVMLLIMAGSAFSVVITLEQIPQSVASIFLGLTSNTALFLLIVTAVLLVSGMFIGGLSLLILLVPMLSALCRCCPRRRRPTVWTRSISAWPWC